MAELVLVYPKTGYDIKKVSVDLPLSVLNLAAMVKDEREVKIIDQRVDSNWEKHLKDELKKDPLAVGVSSMTGTQIRYGLDAAKLTKQNSDTKVIWGGIHATLLPKQTVLDENVDIVAYGEGETSINQTLDALEKKKPLDDVRGLCLKRNGKAYRTEITEILDLDKIPQLPYELVDIKNYIGSRSMIKEGVEKCLPFISSRGCPFECTFCCNPRLSNRRWRSMSVEKTIDGVLAMVERFDLDGVIFHDENFLGNVKRGEVLAEHFNNKFSWSIQARMDSLNKADLRKLERNGLGLVQPGIESGCERILELIKKGETKEKMLDASRKLAKTSIIPVYNFMMGFPTETVAEIYETVDFALQLQQENPNAQIAGFYVLVPYPGTEVYDLAVEQGFKAPKTLAEWAKFSRMHLDTPWIQDNLDLLMNIMYTSKFVDGQRLTNVFKRFHIPKKIANYFGDYYKKKWRKHDFKNSLDIKAMNFITRKYFKWE